MAMLNIQRPRADQQFIDQHPPVPEEIQAYSFFYGDQKQRMQANCAADSRHNKISDEATAIIGDHNRNLITINEEIADKEAELVQLKDTRKLFLQSAQHCVTNGLKEGAGKYANYMKRWKEAGADIKECEKDLAAMQLERTAVIKGSVESYLTDSTNVMDCNKKRIDDKRTMAKDRVQDFLHQGFQGEKTSLQLREIALDHRLGEKLARKSAEVTVTVKSLDEAKNVARIIDIENNTVLKKHEDDSKQFQCELHDIEAATHATQMKAEAVLQDMRAASEAKLREIESMQQVRVNKIEEEKQELQQEAAACQYVIKEKLLAERQETLFQLQAAQQHVQEEDRQQQLQELYALQLERDKTNRHLASQVLQLQAEEARKQLQAFDAQARFLTEQRGLVHQVWQDGAGNLRVVCTDQKVESLKDPQQGENQVAPDGPQQKNVGPDGPHQDVHINIHQGRPAARKPAARKPAAGGALWAAAVSAGTAALGQLMPDAGEEEEGNYDEVDEAGEDP